MPPRFFATVSCPSCGTQFQTPVEQVLDVRVDPNARSRVLSGAVNVAQCPSCGMGGALNIPFVYHDPDNEVALLYLPMSVGNSEVERQQAAGQLTRQLMDAMPPEERKGYLLQPETFINLDTMVKRVLELEGVTEEDMERTRQQQEFIGEFFQAEPEAWEELIAENAELLDESFFSMLQYSMQVAAMSGTESEGFQQAQEAYEYLVDHSEMGQTLARRSEVVQAFLDNPDRKALVDALVKAPDDETVTILVQSGMPLMDYNFFQRLLTRVESARSEEEQQRLKQLRRQVLDLRDELMQASQAIARERVGLLRKLMESEDPLRMARSHLSELDEPFSLVLRAHLEDAQGEGDQEMVDALQSVALLVNQVMEENMPPELALARRLMMAPSEEQVEQALQANREVLGPRFFAFLERLEQESQEQGDVDSAERLAELRTRALRYAPQPPAASQEPQGPQPAGDEPQKPPQSPETTTPSGLIIAKH